MKLSVTAGWDYYQLSDLPEAKKVELEAKYFWNLCMKYWELDLSL